MHAECVGTRLGAQVLERLKPENHKFEASLSNLARHYIKKKKERGSSSVVHTPMFDPQ